MSDSTKPGVPAPPASIVGQLLSVTDNRVQGWAWNPDAPGRRLRVEILDEALVVVASARAARFDRLLVENGIGDGFHGFQARIPPDAFLKSEMLVRARCEGTATLLGGGPLIANRPPVSDSDMIMRLAAPDFSPRIAMRFAWPSADIDPRDLASHAPNEPIDFRSTVHGEGWDRTGDACRIGADGRATLRLSTLLEQPAGIVLTLRGAEREAARMRVGCDEHVVQTSVLSGTASDEIIVHGRLPAGGAIRTSVTLSFEGSSSLVFLSLHIGSSVPHSPPL